MDEDYLEKSKALCLSFYQAFIAFCQNKQSLPSFHIIQQNGIRGIAHDFDKAADFQFAKYMMSHLLAQHQDIGYIKKNYKEDQRKGLTFIRYYMKPSIKLQMEQPAEQLFGNITLELQTLPNKNHRLKIQSSYYNDRNFKPVRDIEEWMDIIFNEGKFNL